MTAIEEFRSRLQGLLKTAEQAGSEASSEPAKMSELLDRFHRYESVVGRLLEEVVRPRVEVTASFFGNASPQRRVPHGHCIWWFGYCERYPASVKLDFSCCHDEEIRHLYVVQELAMVPSYIRYERFDRMVQSLDQVDVNAIIPWTEERLVGFVHTYLQLEAADRNHNQAFATDPVCRMRIIKDQAAGHFDHQGHRFFFCTQSCLAEFAADPDHFALLDCGP